MSAVRVILPAHLKALAGVDGVITVEAEPVTQRTVLDAVEAAHPALLGTMRDRGTARRRAFVRFYVGEEDLSHEAADDPLPEVVASGAEPFRVIGAMAGG